MQTNLWSLPKDRSLRKLLISFEEKHGDHCEIDPLDNNDPAIVTLCHAELSRLRAHVFLHGQRPGTYGVFYEYPHPVPGILETEENLPLKDALVSLAIHFDA